ncbi:DEAD/DEAH box helicase [Spirulina subsalsa]|uniref:DEAD/DEAH box helicase n=1 Tax=Spirulina subsalsa TaxID=54311 RepID=UPI00037FAC70|nr:DEAD/DEAH box helicase [Spirulina subsalsa]
MSISLSSNHLDPTTLFPFQLDSFQKKAIAALDANKSVVVSVPTGSGKTLVGEYAIHRALHRGKRVFYTTPLKALSNQKFRDFRDQFGEQSVGLLTGDASFNRNAPVLVMTTEIFRNMLYGTPIGQVGTSLEGVETVVLDECHYMNDSQRGTVWEESIIYAPPEIQLVALSATIANADQLAEWISQVHGKTELIESNFRPVPLEFYFSNQQALCPLLNESKTQINSRLKGKGRRNPKQRVRREDCPTVVDVVRQLHAQDMLPAIYFIFSRRGCDQAMQRVYDLTLPRVKRQSEEEDSPLILITPEEATLLNERIEAFLSLNPSVQSAVGRQGVLEALYKGIASHHAGILPAWKALIEELFQEGLVKVVFATETLAAGINMPARTTVISTISKRTDHGHRLLTASEFLQMAGRAGRRGMDEMGHVVTVQTPFEGSKDAANLALKTPDPLVSRFTPTYGMVLNLLQTHSVDEAKDLLERSFAQYTATLRLLPEQQAIAELTTELAKLDIELAPVTDQLLQEYGKLSERLREERRLLKTLQHQAEEIRSKEMARQLDHLGTGSIVYIKGKSTDSPLPAVLYAQAPGRGQAPYLICLGRDNRWYVLSYHDLIQVDGRCLSLSALDPLTPPPELPIKRGQHRKGDEVSAAVGELLPDHSPEVPEAPEVLEQAARLEAVQEQLKNHPLNQWGKPSKLIKRHQHRLDLRAALRSRQEAFKQHQTTHWREFTNLVKVLREFDALEQYKPTPLGQAAAAIRGDNELWLGLVLVSGYLDDLDPHHLAALAYVLISEPPRPDSWCNYLPNAPYLQVMDQLMPLRKHLIKCQHRYNVVLPVWLEQETALLSSVVERWALGIDWDELCDNTNFDQGDLVRMLRRTVDFLSQIPHVPGVSEGLQKNARRAIQLMERFPVQEMAGLMEE